MRRLLNTLYITQPEAYLGKDGENIVVSREGERDFRYPLHNIEAIVYFGYPGISPALLGSCMERGITISFLTEYNRFLGRIEGGVSGNVLLRRRQYRMADEIASHLVCSKYTVLAKVFNMRSVLQRGLRDHPDKMSKSFPAVIEELAKCKQMLDECKSLDDIRGVEGSLTRKYFEILDDLILDQKADFYFKNRNRRPPTDCFNALLSFAYTLLTNECRSALETVGLDPAVGFLHRDRPGRASLALDLVEEFRAYLADRFVLTLINRCQIKKTDFEFNIDGSVYLKPDSRKDFLTAWQTRKQEEILHPFLNEKIKIGLLPYAQALLLARYIRGDLDGYPAFLVK